MSWKIGEITKRTGLTARALHFYEERGLIGPVSRSAAGHRIYSRNDLLRLQQLKMLRLLGVSLADIPPLLSNTEQLVPQLKQQQEKLQQQRKSIEGIEAKVSRLIEELETRSLNSDGVDEILFQTLESMTMYEKYFDQNEIDKMHNHNHSEGQSVEDAWQTWVTRMQEACSAGTDPRSKEVQTLMQHWNEMLDHLTGGDEARLQAFNNLLHNEAKAREEHGISDELFAYMAKATPGH